MTEVQDIIKDTFKPNRCFLCGCILNDDNKTEEHIYPKWLQKNYDIRDQGIELLNKTIIPYRQLRIACCKRCNHVMDEKLEKPMQIVMKGGYDGLATIDKYILWQWLNKLDYGTLYKETTLKQTRSSFDSTSIFDSDDLKERTMQYLILRSAIDDTICIGALCSLMLFKLKVNSKRFYWGWDNPYTHTFCMMIGNTGILSCLLDGGYNEKFFREYNDSEIFKEELHPAQFLELCSKFVYKVSLMNRKPTFLNFYQEGKCKYIIANDIYGDVYREWDQKEYARLFEFFLKKFNYRIEGIDSIYQENGNVATLLKNPDGSFHCV